MNVVPKEIVENKSALIYTNFVTQHVKDCYLMTMDDPIRWLTCALSGID